MLKEFIGAVWASTNTAREIVRTPNTNSTFTQQVTISHSVGWSRRLGWTADFKEWKSHPDIINQSGTGPDIFLNSKSTKQLNHDCFLKEIELFKWI